MEIIEFLKESNAIEREYSDRALKDSITAWQYSIKSKFPHELISRDLIKNIHKRLLKNLNPRIAGKLRKVQVGVMTKEGFKEAPHYSKVKNLSIASRFKSKNGVYQSKGFDKAFIRLDIQIESIAGSITIR